LPQATVSKTLRFTGIGLHTGVDAELAIHPAEPGHGIVFQQLQGDFEDSRISAHFRNVAGTRRCTSLANGAGAAVQTVEHLMAALAGCGIANAMVEISGPEVPAMDGSALPFVAEMLAAGVQWQHSEPLQVIKVKRPVVAVLGRRPLVQAALHPSSSFRMRVAIDYPEPIGRQMDDLVLRNGICISELVNCRTFCLGSEIELLQSSGLGIGGVIGENVVVANDLTGEWMTMRRHEAECVRHKMLDAVGDLALAGMPIVGRFEGHRTGHSANVRLLEKLFSDPANYEIVFAGPELQRDLLGVNVTVGDLPNER